MVQTQTDIELIAHLLRRAGFGATRDELARYSAMGYESAVERTAGARGKSSVSASTWCGGSIPSCLG